MGVHAGAHVWRSGDDMEEELVLCFHHVDPRDETSVVRLGCSKHRHQLSHLVWFSPALYDAFLLSLMSVCWSVFHLCYDRFSLCNTGWLIIAA